jgi:threonine/homoserine/homoserine lactone efflux protein
VTLIIAMCVYAYTMATTPGPANLIAMSVGNNYGFKNALPYALGATCGHNTLLAFIGLGLGQLITESGLFLNILSYGGAAYICYMGYKTATSTAELKTTNQDRPMFFQGIFVQWLNPKAWSTSIAGVSAFGIIGDVKLLLIFIGIQLIMVFQALALWAFAGSKIANYLSDDKLKWFNWIMGGSLILIALYLVSVG